MSTPSNASHPFNMGAPIGHNQPQLELSFLEELKSYVGFSGDHARVLALLRDPLAPALPEVVDEFYEAVRRVPQALSVFAGGAAQIERHKHVLTAWLAGLFTGDYGEEYLQMRARIGRTHVRIKLDQRYMLTAMNLVRQGLHRAVHDIEFVSASTLLAHDALDKICDIELAIMLESYAEDSATRLRGSERMAALGQLSGFIGHELRNPLAVMETSLHLLKKRLPLEDEGAARHIRRLSEQVTTCAGIIAALLELASDRPAERKPVAVEALFREVLATLPATDGVSADLVVPSDLPPAMLDEKQIRHLVGNLVGNGLQALADLPKDSIRLLLVGARQSHDVLLVTIEDSGTGIPAEIGQRLFEPLATTRANGLGLGLALCRRVAEKHGGTILVRSSVLGGACFEVSLPGAFEARTP